MCRVRKASCVVYIYQTISNGVCSVTRCCTSWLLPFIISPFLSTFHLDVAIEVRRVLLTKEKTEHFEVNIGIPEFLFFPEIPNISLTNLIAFV